MEMLFKGKRKDTGKWIQSASIMTVACGLKLWIEDNHFGMMWIEIIPDTLGVYTGIDDKKGNKIFSGDLVSWNEPYRSTQTHEGDNIPNGSYTEPMEPAIRMNEGTVVFGEGCFNVDYATHDPVYIDQLVPLQYCINIHDEDSIKDAIATGKDHMDFWEAIKNDDEEDQGNLAYLLEFYKLKDLESLIEHCSGITVTGNINDDEE